jgi:hypothetical protein
MIFLRSLTLRLSKSDPRLFLAIDPKVAEVDQNLAELHLLDESPRNPEGASGIWDLVHNIKSDPYSATMTAFSKLTDKVVFSQSSDEPDLVSSLMNQSILNAFDFGDTLIGANGESADDEDFEVITVKRKILDNLEIRPRSEPVSADKWNYYKNEDGSFHDAESLKMEIFHGGLADSIRGEAWRFLLGLYSWEQSIEEREASRKTKVKDYLRMKQQWSTMSEEQEENFAGFRERKSQIEKDIVRTDRTQEFYEGDSNDNIQLLHDILMTYTMYNFDFGYIQGMSDMLSPILYVTKNEVDAFWCFVGLMKKIHKYFDFDHGGMKTQLLALRDLLKVIDPELYSYFVSKDCESFLFCFRWLLLSFKREFSYEDVLRLWETIWAEVPCKNFQLLVAVTMLHMERSVIIENKFGFPEILKHMNDKSQVFELVKILELADAIYRKLEASSFVNDRILEVLQT